MIGLRLAAYGAAAALVVIVYHNLPLIGPGARIDRIEVSRDAWRSSAQSWIAYGRAEKRAFDESERLRALERAQAVRAQNETQKACAARVARARASGLAIASIVNKEPRRDENGCPVRSLADADLLRDALSARPRR